MKILATILSLYFLALTSVPCSDARAVSECETENISQTEQGLEHEKGDHDDSCAPFCSCQCCQSQLTMIGFPVFEPVNPELRNNPVFYKNTSGKEFSTSLFQPPRV